MSKRIKVNKTPMRSDIGVHPTHLWRKQELPPHENAPKGGFLHNTRPEYIKRGSCRLDYAAPLVIGPPKQMSLEGPDEQHLKQSGYIGLYFKG